MIMNIEAYDQDSLRKLVRDLQKENRLLKKLLVQANIPYEENDVFDSHGSCKENYDPDQGSRINPVFIDKALATQFFAMFWGREDVFARRAKNGNYYPQCANRWNKICPKQSGRKMYCEDCTHKSWVKLTPEMILNHLTGQHEAGTDVVGIYPLFPDGTCRFLVFDFDNHEKISDNKNILREDDSWQEEVDALRVICRKNGIDALVERSRSGRGAHVWIFFRKPVAAATARTLGFLLLDKGMMSINLKSLKYYDRMYPAQDTADTLGNLVALPLQGMALKDGNSAFVDENWNAYPDQWKKLLNTKKLTSQEIDAMIARWQAELSEKVVFTDNFKTAKRLQPWKRQEAFCVADVVGKLHIVLSDGIYVDALNLKPRLQNQIRCMAAMDNPIFYKNRRLGYSNFYQYSAIYLGTDIDGYIKIPRGLLEALTEKCRSAGIAYDIEDYREKGRPVRVSFKGELRERQDTAAESLLAFDNGILSAATAFGKTVVCSYLIAQRKVNTLILLESTDLLSQWEDELERFLQIDEEPPEYKTRTGRIKKRLKAVGILKGGKDTMTGIIDIAMIGSIYKKGAFHESINSYGMVIMDECHHGASATAQEVLKKINAKYVYGVSATPIRSDQLEKINYLLLGPIRHQYTALERVKSQSIGYFVYPRYTRVVDTSFSLAGAAQNPENTQGGRVFHKSRNRLDINEAYRQISKSSVRNEMILEDAKSCIRNGWTPVILTKYKEHAKYLYECLLNEADYIFLLYGDNSAKENEIIRGKLKSIPQKQSLILVATGQKIGEGFDYPRLDTLLLASPVSFAGRLEQYVGRLSRDYPGKNEVIVYDYIDVHIPVFDRMYFKRLKAYKKIGFTVMTEMSGSKQDVQAIYDAGNYTDIFERDLVEAEQEIIISSPNITLEKVSRLLLLVKPRQEAGVKVTVITADPEDNLYGNTDFLYALIGEMRKNGICVRISGNENEHFAVIDQSLVWHGGMNLLGKEDVWDNLIRIKDVKAAAELVALAYEGI